MLVSTDVAAMGLDTDNLNLSLNIGNTNTEMYTVQSNSCSKAYLVQPGNLSNKLAVLVGMGHLQ